MTKAEQVSAQCKAVAHLATALAKVHSDYAAVILAPGSEAIVDQVGKRTAAWMEALGNMLNAIDAADPEDEWMTPIFHEAHRLWPQEHSA